ncbi:MAG TPA: hypothetical protein VNV66_20620 [Pilimelia sp.]|nr:hypothetical protein [Pilimelia sp.]
MAPLDPTAGDYEHLLGAVLAELEHAAQVGATAQRVLDGIQPAAAYAEPVREGVDR